MQSPAPPSPLPPHTVPSTPPEQLFWPRFGSEPHVPSVAPAAIVHVPVQQSLDFAQTSPAWMQNDAESWHTPPEQSVEQHCSPPAVHELPAVRQELLSGVHVPFEPQTPPQHWSFEVHAWLSDVHCVPLHFPLWQLSEQQSVATLHVPFASVQFDGIPPMH